MCPLMCIGFLTFLYMSDRQVEDEPKTCIRCPCAHRARRYYVSWHAPPVPRMLSIQQVIETLTRMEAEGIIQRYAIGGAVGATFYLEPVATLDVDVFVAFGTNSGSLLISPEPIFQYLRAHGGRVEGEYIHIAGWPVQFLPPTGPLVEEALADAVTIDVQGTPARVFTAEHLAVIALQTGRAKDKARLLQFIEAGVLDAGSFQEILARHGLADAWHRFAHQFLADEP